MVTHDLRARLTDPTAAGARAGVTEPIWNFVWWRRITYFATLTATLLLLALPLFVGRLPTPPVLADGRTGIGGVIRLSDPRASGLRRRVGRSLCKQSVLLLPAGGGHLLFLKAWHAAGAHAARRGASHVEAGDGR